MAKQFVINDQLDKLNSLMEEQNDVLKAMAGIEDHNLKTIVNHFNLNKDGKIYGVKFPIFGDTKTAQGVKYGANEGLVIEPSTRDIEGRDDYRDILLFQHQDVNAHLEEDGRLIIDGIRGDQNFHTHGAVDVCTITCDRYYRYYRENGYEHYEMSDTYHQGFHLAKECEDVTTGASKGYGIYAKCVAGEIDGKLYSSFGLIPSVYPFKTICYNNNVSYYHAKGSHYSAMKLSELIYLQWMYMIKYASKNIQQYYGGCTGYYNSYVTTVAETNTNRVIIKTSEANNLEVDSYVSVGTSNDRNARTGHDIAHNVRILSIETYDSENSAIALETSNFDSVVGLNVMTMHYASGFSEDILGDDGVYKKGTASNSQKFPCCLNGIELMVGTYEVLGNAVFNIEADNTYRLYTEKDSTKLTTTVSNILNNYHKDVNGWYSHNTENWCYISDVHYDLENGVYGAKTNALANSSNSYSDAFYANRASSGQREFLAFGSLNLGSYAGLWYCGGSYGLGFASWSFASRPSLNG